MGLTLPPPFEQCLKKLHNWHMKASLIRLWWQVGLWPLHNEQYQTSNIFWRSRKKLCPHSLISPFVFVCDVAQFWPKENKAKKKKKKKFWTELCSLPHSVSPFVLGSVSAQFLSQPEKAQLDNWKLEMCFNLNDNKLLWDCQKKMLSIWEIITKLSSMCATLVSIPLGLSAAIAWWGTIKMI